MINNELLAFIKEGLEKKVSREEISKILVANGGWNDEDIREAFAALPERQEPPAVSPMVSPIISKLPHPEAARPFSPAAFSMGSVPPHDGIFRPLSSSLAVEGGTPSEAARTAAHLADNNPFFQTFAAKARNENEAKNRNRFVLSGGGKPAASGESAKTTKTAKHRGWVSFFIFILLMLALFAGALFAYFRGYVPGISLPFLDEIGQKFLSTMEGSGSSRSNVSQISAQGIVIDNNAPDPIRVDYAANQDQNGMPPAEAPNAKQHYRDRVSLLLPSGTPVSVTTLASTIAGEWRGRVESCIYAAGENRCVLVLPVKDEPELQSVLSELDGDTRLKGAEAVILEQ